ncbi:MAG: transglycosylase SLT domain-containing protein [Bacteroidetes bacterium]|nr:transglycosylase SLT domain-containing protein [Bacteroidota bacterium]
MKGIFSVVFAVFCLSIFNAQADRNFNVVNKTVITYNDTLQLHFLQDSTMHTQGWDTLPQAIFWRDVINMTSDTCIVNISYCRKPINRVNRSVWMSQTEPQKLCYKDSLCKIYEVESADHLFVTAGKGEFYEVKKVLPIISRAITAFEKNSCDPWYAQAIMLIESPGKLKSKSSVGANGPFQLMKSVAIRYGLKVNKYVDERSDIDKSAKAASSLIKTSCIPYIRKFLDEKGVTYSETDLWFRLLVLHAYHAGPGNVRCVIDAINPTAGGVKLFEKIWQTTCGGFKNESQNYSQIALASLINFNGIIEQTGDTVYLVKGDVIMKNYDRKKMKPWEAFDYLNTCLETYEKDFIDDMIPYDYFLKKVTFIRKEFVHLASVVTQSQKDVVLRKYPASEMHVNNLANQLTKRQRYEDAIKMFKLNLDENPTNLTSLDSLAKLYRITGDHKNAEFYTSKAVNTKVVQKNSE